MQHKLSREEVIFKSKLQKGGKDIIFESDETDKAPITPKKKTNNGL